MRRYFTLCLSWFVLLIYLPQQKQVVYASETKLLDFGVCHFTLDQMNEKRRLCKDRLKLFIWKQWVNRKQATAKAIWVSKEGDESENVYLIQQGSSGSSWVVKVEIKRLLYERKNASGEKTEMYSSFTASEVSLLRIKRAEEYTLRLKNAKGEILQEF
jgi:hypothetical protein